MKKLLSILLLVALVCSMTACGGSANTPAASTPAASTPAAETPPAADAPAGSDKITIGAIFYKYDDAYTSSVRQALEDVAKTNSNVELLLNDSKNDQGTQNDQIDVLIQKGIDVLVLSVVDIGAAQTVIDKVKGAGIPVIFFNREPPTDVIKSYDKCRFVGTKPEEAGIIQGEMVLELWNSDKKWDKNGDGKMNYVMLIGDPDNPEAIARTKYSVDTVVASGIECVKLGDAVCYWDADKANTATEAWIAKDGDNIEMIFSNNDSQASGSISALQNAGFNNGGDKFIPIFGVDATDEAQDLIGKGFMSGTVKQDAVGMAQGVFALAVNAAGGADFLEGTSYKYDDSGVAIRIPYVAFVK